MCVCVCVCGKRLFFPFIYEREQTNNTTSSRHIRRYRSFQNGDPQVAQVTYGEGRKGNAFVSQRLPRCGTPEHAKRWIYGSHCRQLYTCVNCICVCDYHVQYFTPICVRTFSQICKLPNVDPPHPRCVKWMHLTGKYPQKKKKCISVFLLFHSSTREGLNLNAY